MLTTPPDSNFFEFQDQPILNDNLTLKPSGISECHGHSDPECTHVVTPEPPKGKYQNLTEEETGYFDALRTKGQALADIGNKWQENGHMKGCYHAEYPEEGSRNCQSRCKQFRTALVAWNEVIKKYGE